MMTEIVRHENLPTTIEELRKRLLAIVALDIIMLPSEKSWLRVHRKVKSSNGLLDIFDIDNGSGDNLFVIFSDDGCILKGFDHESRFSPHTRDNFSIWPGIYDRVPENLIALLNDSLFEKELVTFCVWRSADDTDWLKGAIKNPNNFDDGFNFLCGYLSNSASDYCDWAEAYFSENTVPLNWAEQIFAGAEINDTIIRSINPNRNTTEALSELAELFNSF